MRVTCVQMTAKLGDVHFNVNKIVNLIEESMKEHPDTKLIVFPELISTGYMCSRDEFQEIAEVVPNGTSMVAISKAAKENNVSVVYGFAERDPLGIYFTNTPPMGSFGAWLTILEK